MIEQAYDRVPREILLGGGVLKIKRVPCMYVMIIYDEYNKARTSVKSMCGNTENFTVWMDVHQESALSSYLFAIVINELTKRV